MLIKKLKRFFAKRFVKLILPFIWMGLIFGLSSIPNIGNTPLGQPFIFKIIGHILGYAVFTFLLITAIEVYLPKTKESNCLETLLLTAVVAISVFLIALLNEFFQILIPGRGGCLRDVGLDSIGILLAFGAWGILRKIRRRQK